MDKNNILLKILSFLDSLLLDICYYLFDLFHGKIDYSDYMFFYYYLNLELNID